MVTAHYGIVVNSEVPVTGVISNNAIEFLGEEIDKGIDLTFEEHCKECEEDDHSLCMLDEMPGDRLIGKWKKNAEGLYEPNREGEYSAIVGELYTQVVWSVVRERCALCSPCYPGQGDIGSKGEFLAYTLPSEIMGEKR